MLSALASLPLAKWLPNETLYSWASRQHLLAGNSSHRATCHQLFAHSQRGSAHDLPSRIDVLVERSAGLLGRADEIVFERTLAPFYFPFADPIKAENAISAMRGDGLGSTKVSLGLLTSGFRANHPLKACLDCMREDVSEHTTAYWHLSHQIPGVWICQRHRTPLAEATIKSTGVHRFLWHLPSPHVLTAAKHSDAPALERLAAVATSIHRAGRQHFAPGRVRATYREQARRMGYDRGGESLQLGSMAQAYAADAAPLRCIPELTSLPANADEAYVQLTKLLGTRCPTHSLRHAAAIAWLFRSFEAFEASYSVSEPAASSPPAIATPTVRQAASLSVRDDIAEALRTSDASATSIAARLGVDVTTVMAVSALACPSRPLGRRPKVLIAEKRHELINALRRGIDKRTVAGTAGVSVSTVTRVLRTEPGLQEQWHRACDMTARADARQTWQRIIGQNPLLGVKALRLLEPATYAWLYRNDRAWLDERKPADQVKAPAILRVRWDTRDRELADSINRVALELASGRGAASVGLWEIYQRLPDLKAKLRKLDRLPLTAKALSRIVTRGQR